MSDLSQISKNIKIYRERMGLTQRVLAEHVLVSFQAISAWERGQSVPDLENALRLADFFGISLDALVAEPEQVYLVGIDGNTNTELVLFKRNGTVERVVTCEGVNPTELGVEYTVKALDTGLEILLRGKQPKSIFAGITGASRKNCQDEIEQELSTRFSSKVEVDTNAANVLSIGKDPSDSMAVICRTGSCVYVRKGDARYRVGGWGNMLEQAGSAYDVGKDAIRHALAVEDGLEHESGLSRLIQRELGGSVFERISEISRSGRSYISNFKDLVLQSAQNEDPAAMQILQRNAQTLGMLLKTAVERYGKPSQVVAAGSILKNRIFCSMVEEYAGIRMEIPEIATVYGACLEAMRVAGLTVCDGFFENFADSYKRKKASELFFM